LLNVEGYLVLLSNDLNKRKTDDVPEAQLVKDIGVVERQISDHQSRPQDMLDHLSTDHSWFTDMISTHDFEL